MVLAGFWLAYLIRFELGLSWFYQPEVMPTEFYRSLSFMLAPLWVIVLFLFRLYDFKNLFSGMSEYAHIFNATTLGMMLLVLFIFFVEKDTDIARGWVVVSWLTVSFMLLWGRFTYRRWVQYMRTHGRFLTSVLVVGGNEEARAIVEQLCTNPKSGVWIAGVIDDTQTPGTELVEDVPILGRLDSLEVMVRQYGIQEIIIASTALPREQLLKVFNTFATADDITVRLSSGLYELMTTAVEVQEIGSVPLLSVSKVRLTGADVVMKTMLDVGVSLLALLLIWPVMIAIAVAIKLDSPGPIFYRRRVVGVGGKLFDALKFRTMYVDADARLAQDPLLRRRFEKNFKLKDDPRVTRVGRFLRRTSLDELPQLFNVLFRQMSLVGPRMITEGERQRYGKWQLNLSTVRPGITGLWQVSGRSDVGYEERVMLDMYYIRNYSIWLDLHLLWRTIPAVLKGRGAY
ncbi:MAG: sugar transferase [Chloroflexi bacterium]|nr:MAG: sugar transferase [Chloroflexota bacterium]